MYGLMMNPVIILVSSKHVTEAVHTTGMQTPDTRIIRINHYFSTHTNITTCCADVSRKNIQSDTESMPCITTIKCKLFKIGYRTSKMTTVKFHVSFVPRTGTWQRQHNLTMSHQIIIAQYHQARCIHFLTRKLYSILPLESFLTRKMYVKYHAALSNIFL